MFLWIFSAWSTSDFPLLVFLKLDVPLEIKPFTYHFFTQ